MTNFSVLLCVLFVLVAYLDVSVCQEIDVVLSQTVDKLDFNYLLQTVAANPALLNQKNQKGSSPLLLAVVHGEVAVAKEVSVDIIFKLGYY